jgi:hypothetical protein
MAPDPTEVAGAQIVWVKSNIGREVTKNLEIGGRIVKFADLKNK